MIKHSGIISKKTDNKYIVDIETQSACASCHAKAMCTSLDKKTKQIEITIKDNSFQEGEAVFVLLTEKLGKKAMILAYFIPFIILMISLIVFLNVLNSELTAGLISIGLLIPYYFILFLFRKRIEKKFNFNIEKNNIK